MSCCECTVCGYLFDEEKGKLDNGLAAGTKWQDVPPDWLCPNCGTGKKDFKLLEDTATSEHPQHKEDDAESHTKPIVIIGTGLAGYNLAKEFRKLDHESPLIIITADDGRSYSKPMLSIGFTKNNNADDLVMADAGSMAKQLNASVWTFTHINAINIEKQALVINHANTINYSKLVIACGADTISPPIEGNALEHVYSINNLLDYADFRTSIKMNNVKKVVIIGSGLIGCEFTNDLINGEFEVETVDALNGCLPALLPEVAGCAVQHALEEKGAKFHFDALVTQVNNATSGEGLEISLNNGKTLTADIVLSAIGVRPHIKLAQDSGIHCGRGILANRYLETSAKNIYTLGDCAEVEGNVLFYVAPLMACARALAKTLAGVATQVQYPAMPVTIKTPACPVVVSPPAKSVEGEWSISQDGNNVVAQFKDSSDNLLGFALTGNATKQKLQLQKLLPAILD